MSSILTDTKASLNIVAEDTSFDSQLLMLINSVLLSVTQIGVGPSTGFYISGVDEEWEDLIGEASTLISVKTYISLKVRLIFDPPTSGFLLDAISNQIKEVEWRLRMQAEFDSDLVAAELAVSEVEVEE